MIKLESGDFLERYYKDFIREKIPSYELIWGSFIGNDGNCNMITIHGFPQSENDKRLNLSEYLYTCLESIICMKEISEQKMDSGELSISEYLILINLKMAFDAHVGRFRDNAKNLMKLYLSCSDVDYNIKDISDLYKERCAVLHGIKIPYEYKDGKFYTTKTEVVLKLKKSNWDDPKYLDNEEYFKHMSNSTNRICDFFQSILIKAMKPVIDKIIDEHDIDLSDFSIHPNCKPYSGISVCYGSAGSGFSSRLNGEV